MASVAGRVSQKAGNRLPAALPSYIGGSFSRGENDKQPRRTYGARVLMELQPAASRQRRHRDTTRSVMQAPCSSSDIPDSFAAAVDAHVGGMVGGCQVNSSKWSPGWFIRSSF